MRSNGLLFVFPATLILLSCSGVRDQPEVAKALQQRSNNVKISVTTEAFGETDSVHVRVYAGNITDSAYDAGKAMMLALEADHEARRTGLIAQVTISSEPLRQTFSFRRNDMDVALKHFDVLADFGERMQAGNYKSIGELLSPEAYPNDSLKNRVYADLAGMSRLKGRVAKFTLISFAPVRTATGETKGYWGELHCTTVNDEHLVYKLRFGKNANAPRIEEIRYEILIGTF